MKTKGLTLLEIMIVVAIIGLVAAIAIPAVTRLAEDVRADICRTNLNTIDKSKMQWAFDNNKSDTDEPTADELDNYVVGEVPTECVVAGALYDIGNVITPALCSFHGDGVVRGTGITFPPDIITLIEAGQLEPSDVIDGDWSWSPDSFTTYDSIQYQDGSHSFSLRDNIKLTSSCPKISVNGNTLTGANIRHYSPEYIDMNMSYYEGRRDSGMLFGKNDKGCGEMLCTEYYEMQMGDKGGYKVLKSPSEEAISHSFYDYQGNSLGYIEGRKLEVSPGRRTYLYGYYDKNGNFLGGYNHNS